ncbi:MAG: hypothetical protein WC022_04475 [Parcubacteria group bacterium]
MTLRAYIWGIRIVTLISFFALGAIIVYIDPQNSAWVGLALFYLAAFFGVSGIFNLLLLFIRRKLLGEELAADSVGLSFRQGILLAVITLGILIMQSFRVLVWWDALLVAAGAFIVELYFLSRE